MSKFGTTHSADLVALERAEVHAQAEFVAATKRTSALERECYPLQHLVGSPATGANAGTANAAQLRIARFQLEEQLREHAHAAMTEETLRLEYERIRQARIAAERIPFDIEFERLEARYATACEQLLLLGEACNAHIDRGIARGLCPSQMHALAGPGSALGRIRAYVETRQQRMAKERSAA